MKYYKCKECGDVHAEKVQWCDRCCGVEFKTIDMSVSKDDSAYDERDNNG